MMVFQFWLCCKAFVAQDISMSTIGFQSNTPVSSSSDVVFQEFARGVAKVGYEEPSKPVLADARGMGRADLGTTTRSQARKGSATTAVSEGPLVSAMSIVTNNIRNALRGGKLAFFLWCLCATRTDVAPDVHLYEFTGTNIHRVPHPRSDAESLRQLGASDMDMAVMGNTWHRVTNARRRRRGANGFQKVAPLKYGHFWYLLNFWGGSGFNEK